MFTVNVKGYPSATFSCAPPSCEGTLASKVPLPPLWFDVCNDMGILSDREFTMDREVPEGCISAIVGDIWENEMREEEFNSELTAFEPIRSPFEMLNAKPSRGVKRSIDTADLTADTQPAKRPRSSTSTPTSSSTCDSDAALAKKEKRRLRNIESAQKSRDNKINEFNKLEESVVSLTKENEGLFHRAKMLEIENRELKNQLKRLTDKNIGLSIEIFKRDKASQNAMKES